MTRWDADPDPPIEGAAGRIPGHLGGTVLVPLGSPSWVRPTPVRSVGIATERPGGCRGCIRTPGWGPAVAVGVQLRMLLHPSVACPAPDPLQQGHRVRLLHPVLVGPSMGAAVAWACWDMIQRHLESLPPADTQGTALQERTGLLRTVWRPGNPCPGRSKDSGPAVGRRNNRGCSTGRNKGYRSGRACRVVGRTAAVPVPAVPEVRLLMLAVWTGLL
jgi:hypothetical protein